MNLELNGVLFVFSKIYAYFSNRYCWWFYCCWKLWQHNKWIFTLWMSKQELQNEILFVWWFIAFQIVYMNTDLIPNENMFQSFLLPFRFSIVFGCCRCRWLFNYNSNDIKLSTITNFSNSYAFKIWLCCERVYWLLC